MNKVQVIRDPRDATRDFWIKADVAHRLFTEGKLDFDLTNRCYITKTRDVVPATLH